MALLITLIKIITIIIIIKIKQNTQNLYRVSHSWVPWEVLGWTQQ